jgi:NitT/TauT family transport system substrate-binding protein
LKKTDRPLDVDSFVNDKFIREACQELGLNYDAQLKDYAAVPFNRDALDTHAPVSDPKLAGQVWVQDEPTVRLYSSVQAALFAAGKLQNSGKKIRAIFAQDRLSGIKLFAERAWFVDKAGGFSAFLLKTDADKWAKDQGGSVIDYPDAQKAAANGLAGN